MDYSDVALVADVSKMPLRLRIYWTRGKGAARIRWGQPHDFDRCVKNLLEEGVPAKMVKGACANLHKEAIGVWPGQEDGGRRASIVANYDDDGYFYDTDDYEDLNEIDDGLTHAGILLQADDTGRWLMLQRALADDDDNGGLWEFPGGGRDDTETPLDAATREFAEECGVGIPDGAYVHGAVISPTGNYILYICSIDEESEYPLDEREHVNPDDPDGDSTESLAWWDPDHVANGGDYLRPEVELSDWEKIQTILGNSPDENEVNVPITAAVGGSLDLPIADRDTPWDGAGAGDRVFEKATGSDGSLDVDTVTKAFLWRDPNADEQNKGSYKFPIADVINGQIQIVPKGVSAAAGRLDSATDVNKDAVATRICSLYDEIRNKFSDWPECPVGGDNTMDNITAAAEDTIPQDAGVDETVTEDVVPPAQDGALDPADARILQSLANHHEQMIIEIADFLDAHPDSAIADELDQHSEEAQAFVDDVNSRLGSEVPAEDVTVDETMSAPEPTADDALVASAAANLIAPPDEWFEAFDLGGPTPITITAEGRVYGHLASWKECHRNPALLAAGQCVRPPSDPNPAFFYSGGQVLTASGALIDVGRLTVGGGHADVRKNLVAALEHYDDASAVGAVVRVHEDEYGIGLFGSVVADATPEQVAAMRRSPFSGDWRKERGRYRLVAAHAVNTGGYPIPREAGLVASVTDESFITTGRVQCSSCGEDGGVSESVVASITDAFANEMQIAMNETKDSIIASMVDDFDELKQRLIDDFGDIEDFLENAVGDDEGDYGGDSSDEETLSIEDTAPGDLTDAEEMVI